MSVVNKVRQKLNTLPRLATMRRLSNLTNKSRSSSYLSDAEEIRKGQIHGQSVADVEVWYDGNISMEMVKRAIPSQSVADMVVEYGQTPLHHAAEHSSKSNAEVVCYIAKKASDVNEKDRWGFTPLHYAAGNVAGGSGYAVRTLVSHGANANALRKDGWSPLINAAKFGNLVAVKELVTYGASIDAEDGWDKSAYDYARELGFKNMAKWLKGRAKALRKDQAKYNEEVLRATEDLLCPYCGMNSEGYTAEERGESPPSVHDLDEGKAHRRAKSRRNHGIVSLLFGGLCRNLPQDEPSATVESTDETEHPNKNGDDGAGASDF